MKILNYLAIFLSVAQIGFVVYFLAVYSTDNMPLFIFLFFVPLVNIFAVIFNKK
ncbi:MAG: hypothetical protein V1819_00735 [bacterium]